MDIGTQGLNVEVVEDNFYLSYKKEFEGKTEGNLRCQKIFIIIPLHQYPY